MAQTVAIGLRRAGMGRRRGARWSDRTRPRPGPTATDVVVLDRDLPGVHGDDICAAALVDEACRSPRAHADGGPRPWTIWSMASASAPTTTSRNHSTFLSSSRRIGALVRRFTNRRSRRCSGTAISRSILRAGAPAVLERASSSRPKEFAVLELLLSSQGRTVSAEELLERGVGRGPPIRSRTRSRSRSARLRGQARRAATHRDRLPSPANRI